MKYIDFEELEIFHQKIIEKTGGSPGVRDRHLLESELNKPFQTFDGQDLYIGIIDKISAITFSLISNHGFVDGNKRIGVAVMVFLLRFNNIDVEYAQKDLIELGLGVASGQMKESDVKVWIERKMVKKA